MEPTAVTWVVLGLIALRARTGYDIKRAIDGSIRHFWAASYGQIYPELKRLEDAGWIKGKDAAQGGRGRREYRITAAGRKALESWLHGRETRMELRDESLLRIYFADTLPRGEALALLESRKRGFGEMLEYLRGVEARATRTYPSIDLVLEWGIDYCEWSIEWCERKQRRLRRAA